MRSVIASFAAGFLFGFGLLISGLANPEKVLGFLDLAGPWDPSLALVMGGAILVGILAFSIARKRTLSLLGFTMKIPGQSQIDKRLIIGGLLFGVGWGVAGICPGPGIVGLGAGKIQSVVFVAAMVAGMGIFELIERARAGTRKGTGYEGSAGSQIS